ETLADATLDDVLEVDDAQQAAVLRDRQRGAAGLGNLVGLSGEFPHRRVGDRWPQRRGTPDALGRRVYRPARPGQYRIDRALADQRAVEVDAGQPRLRRERDE